MILFDLSDEMLAAAKEKAAREGVRDRIEFHTGDMAELPFEENQFDAVLSTYSLCPLHDPAKGAAELYRVTKPGGLLGVGHSTDSTNPVVRWVAERVEAIAWRLPSLSMGCRSIEVLPAIEQAGGNVAMVKRIGVPLWPFIIFVIAKPASDTPADDG